MQYPCENKTQLCVKAAEKPQKYAEKLQIFLDLRYFFLTYVSSKKKYAAFGAAQNLHFYKDLTMSNIKRQLLRSFQKLRIFPRSHQALCNIKQ